LLFLAPFLFALEGKLEKGRGKGFLTFLPSPKKLLPIDVARRGLGRADAFCCTINRTSRPVQIKPAQAAQTKASPKRHPPRPAYKTHVN
jgi:hypothetical protein